MGLGRRGCGGVLIGRNSLNEAALQALIADPERAGDYSAEVRRQAREIRATFVRQLGWDTARLGRYRFRDLATLARPARVVPALLRGGADIVAMGHSEDVLQIMSLMSNAEAAAYAQHRLGIGETLQAPLREKALLLTDDELRRIESLVARYSGEHRRKRRDDRRWLGETILEMLERAYEVPCTEISD